MTKFVLLRDGNFTRRLAIGRPRDPFPSRIGPRSRGAARVDQVPPEPLVEMHDMTEGDVRAARRDPSILAMARPMPLRLIEPLASDTETHTGPTWGVEAVGATRTSYDGAGVDVAVLDTGIDPHHPAFAGVRLEMQNFTGGRHTDPDRQGHGTHCAGTIFGREVNGTRIGVAPGITRALIGKVLGDDGGGSSEMLFDGMQWARREGARVISMSLGFDLPGAVADLIEQGWPAKLAASAALESYRENLRIFDSIMAMFDAQAVLDGGMIVVAAAGNESERRIDPRFEISASLPAAADDVISVGAAGQGADGLTIAEFSNTNPILSGPGVDVISARLGGGLVALRGTSMACPHVAGCAALWWQAISGRSVPLTADAVTARLRAHADAAVFADGVDIADRGEGLVQAPAMVAV
jgi:subtilisin family serine protease